MSVAVATHELDAILGSEIGTTMVRGAQPVWATLAALSRVQCRFATDHQVAALQRPVFLLAELASTLQTLDIGFGRALRTRVIERAELVGDPELACGARWSTTIDAIDSGAAGDVVHCVDRLLGPDQMTTIVEVERSVLIDDEPRRGGIGEVPTCYWPRRSSACSATLSVVAREVLGLNDVADADSLLVLGLLPLAGSELGLCDSNGWRFGELRFLADVRFQAPVPPRDAFAIRFGRPHGNGEGPKIGFAFISSRGRQFVIGHPCFRER